MVPSLRASRAIALVASLVLLAACTPEEEAVAPDPVRAVKTELVETRSPTQERAFPAVLEPPQITPLAFEVAGRLGPVDLQIGQRVEAGAVLMRVEPEDFELRLQQAQASLTEVESALRDATEEARRQLQLFERGVGAEATRDTAVARREQAEARVQQARRNVELVEASRADTALRAPFDGIVNSIDVRSFQSVQPGVPTVTLYRDDGLQAQILVSYGVVSELALGRTVEVAPSDGPERRLEATVTEIARRAPSVASFPVVVSLLEPSPDLRSGMAVEVLVEMPIGDGRSGMVLPVTALATQRIADLAPDEGGSRAASVFVFDPENSTVAPRDIAVGGIAGSEMVVIDGLADSERVVTAGVTHLRAGQKVTLWGADALPTPREPDPIALPDDAETPSATDAVVTSSVTPELTGERADARASDVTVTTVPIQTSRSGPREEVRDADPVRADLIADGTPELKACEPIAFAADEEGRMVASMHRALSERGHDAGPADGIMGERTRTALTAFQQSEGIEPTGEPCGAVLSTLGIEAPASVSTVASAPADPTTVPTTRTE